MSKALKKHDIGSQPQRRVKKVDEFVHTSLFSEVFVFNDIPLKFKGIWEQIEDSGRYHEFFNNLISVFGSIDPDEAYNWNVEKTFKNLVYPVLEALGYGSHKSKNHSFLENQKISLKNDMGETIDCKPSLMICEDEKGKNYIKNATSQKVKFEIKSYLKVPMVVNYYASTYDRKASKYDLKKDDIGKRGDVFSSFGPNEQVSEYLSAFDKPWGIFTDGAVWRLFRKEASTEDSDKYFEFDFKELFDLYRTSDPEALDEHSHLFEVAKYFFWFFSNDAIFGQGDSIPFIEKVYQGSQGYVEKIEDDLKERFVHGMTIACNGYLKTVRKFKVKEDINLISKTSESLLFNLIFIRACESRRVLPIHGDYISYSLKALIEKIRYFSNESNASESLTMVKKAISKHLNSTIKDDGFEVYDYVKSLHDLVEKGNFGFGIAGFKESVFYPEEERFFNKFKIDNSYMISLLHNLFFYEGGGVQIPYNLITPRQLGSIYESFLEFQPEIAKSKMFFIRKVLKNKVHWQWVKEDEVPKNRKNTLAFVKKSGIIFSPDNDERKVTGSYYTPDHIVKYIVNNVLSPLIEGKNKSQILNLRIVDPAIGSGHFLIGALEFISKSISRNTNNMELSEIKRSVLDSCLFGVDKNPSAIKLSKMSLWLDTAVVGQKLEKLTDQLIVANSLVNESIWRDNLCKNNLKFDAVIGNPPYLGQQGNKEVFKPLRDSSLGKRFNDSPMDLFYYFFHLSLDLVKEKGRIGFITTNYFVTADGAGKLRQDLFSRSTISQLINFNTLRIFKGAQGQHNLITILDKCSDSEFKTTVWNLRGKGNCNKKRFQEILRDQKPIEVNKGNLFDGDSKYIRLSGVSCDENSSGGKSALDKMVGKGNRLDEQFEVLNGLRSGIDKITQKHVKDHPGLIEGQGIFVVKKSEVASKYRNGKNSILKDYYKNSDISKYIVKRKTDLLVFYTNRDTDINKHQEIKKYLAKNKKIIERFRWSEGIPWYSLVRPRKEIMFIGEMIVCPQRSRVNTFGYTDKSWFSGSDVFYIKAKKNVTNKMSYKCMLGLLNSKTIYFWLFHKGKKKGDNLELIKKPVSEIRIPTLCKKDQIKVERIVDKILKNGRDDKLENSIDKILFGHYGFSKKEIDEIERTYPNLDENLDSVEAAA